MKTPSHRSAFAALLLAALGASVTPALAQNNPDSGRRRGGDAGGSGGDRGDRGGRGNFDPQEMQQRMLGSLRERLEVTDDAEWKLISERVMKVSELRRSTGGGMGGMMWGGRGGPGGPGGPGGGDRSSGGGGGDRGPGRGGPRPGGNQEMDLLSSALRDKLPDAEVKARLDRFRESRKANEARLAKAQEDLRAVLSVRQEAIAVVFGLLP
jgi:hypothetical protein